jgi:protein gp37
MVRDYTFRIDFLRRTGAKVRCISLEPLLGRLEDLERRRSLGYRGMPVGAGRAAATRKLGDGHRGMSVLLPRSRSASSSGGGFKSLNGRTLEGRTWAEMPRQGK